MFSLDLDKLCLKISGKKRLQEIKICRLCGKSCEYLIHIYGRSSCFSLIEESVLLPVKENDGLPPTICRNCCKMMQEFMEFRMNCKKVYRILRAYVVQESLGSREGVKGEGNEISSDEDVEVIAEMKAPDRQFKECFTSNQGKCKWELPKKEEVLLKEDIFLKEEDGNKADSKVNISWQNPIDNEFIVYDKMAGPVSFDGVVESNPEQFEGTEEHGGHLDEGAGIRNSMDNRECNDGNSEKRDMAVMIKLEEVDLVEELMGMSESESLNEGMDEEEEGEDEIAKDKEDVEETMEERNEYFLEKVPLKLEPCEDSSPYPEDEPHDQLSPPELETGFLVPGGQRKSGRKRKGTSISQPKAITLGSLYAPIGSTPICYICDQKFQSQRGLAIHLTRKHFLANQASRESGGNRQPSCKGSSTLFPSGDRSSMSEVCGQVTGGSKSVDNLVSRRGEDPYVSVARDGMTSQNVPAQESCSRLDKADLLDQPDTAEKDIEKSSKPKKKTGTDETAMSVSFKCLNGAQDGQVDHTNNDLTNGSRKRRKGRSYVKNTVKLRKKEKESTKKAKEKVSKPLTAPQGRNLRDTASRRALKAENMRKAPSVPVK